MTREEMDREAARLESELATLRRRIRIYDAETRTRTANTVTARVLILLESRACAMPFRDIVAAFGYDNYDTVASALHNLKGRGLAERSGHRTWIVARAKKV